MQDQTNKPTFTDNLQAIQANLPLVYRKYTTWIIALATFAGGVWVNLDPALQAALLMKYPVLAYWPWVSGAVAVMASAIGQGLPAAVTGSDIAQAKQVDAQ